MKHIVRVLMASLTFAAAIATAAVEVDLDKPGALEALARDRPAHYKRVSEEMSKAQEIRVDPEPTLQKAETVTVPSRGGDANPFPLYPGTPRFIPSDADIILPADPAKKRLVVLVDGITYRVTVHMTKHPAHLQKAK
jgi:hypothetical protein